jgi:hypothetical protein
MKQGLIRFVAAAGVTTALLLTTGCNTVSISSKQYLGSPTYAPSNPAQIQILQAPPTRPHVRLGEVQAEPSSDSVSVQKIEQSMREAAAKMGADAVVIVYDRDQIVGAFVSGPWWGRSVNTVTGRVIIGVAIKYTNEATHQ